jgi:DNA polymerase I-like protein with 3'-5' exonuclease and polymerase domains
MFEQTDHAIQQQPWMKGKKFVLGTVENLATAIDQCIASKRYGLDLETSGLDNRVFQMPSGAYQTVDQIAGVCLSPDGIIGYYFPLHHAKVVNGERIAYECNLPVHVFDVEFSRLMEATEKGLTTAIFHNGKFDHEFLQFNETGHPWGEWDKPSSWQDTLILRYLHNSRARRKKLKDMVAAPTDATDEHMCGGPGLGLEMIHLYELFGHESEQKNFRYDFTTLDPRDGPALWYACSDAICTYLLHDVVAPPVLTPDTDGVSMTTLYAIEKSCVAATRWMERCRIHVDRKKLGELIALGQQEWWDAIQEVYASAKEVLGRDVMPPVYRTIGQTFEPANMNRLLPQQIQVADSQNKNYKPSRITKSSGEWPSTYDVEAPAQIGVMFEEMGVPGLKRTENSDQVKTSKDELERIIEETGEQFPFMGKIRRFREVAKALSTFLYPMYLDSDPRDDTMRINFNAHKIDTGRFATPAKESATGDGNRAQVLGFPQVNIQATPNMNNPDRPACMLRIRECITARPVAIGKPPKFVVAIDYSGVELRIVTNVSREPKWIAEFFHCSTCDARFTPTERPPLPNGKTTRTPLPPPARCPNCGSDKIGDLHTLTGIAIYGADAPSKSDWKALRGRSKGVNFALCYGGGPNAVVRAAGVDKNEGARIKRTFDGTYAGLKTWWGQTHKLAKQHKFVRTAFGRRYPLPDINHPDGGFRSKAERNAVNGPIQGTSADITKLAMALIYKEMKKRGWLEKVMLTITMHDELVFEIDGDVIEEAIPLLVQIMTANDLVLSLGWPIPLTSDVEAGYGWDVPWDLNGMTYGEVRFIGNKKYKDPKKLPEGYVWDNLPSWPEALQPWFKIAGGQGAAPVVAPPLAPPAAAPETAPAAPSETAPVVHETQAALPAAVTVAATPSTFVVSAPSKPDINGEVYTYRLRNNMTVKTAQALAELIRETANRGTRLLKLQAKSGEAIEGWLDEAGIGPVRIDAMTFEVLARKANL